MNDSRRLLALSALALGDLAALVTLRPDGALVAQLTSPHTWVREAGADGAAITLASAALWCVALWLGLGLLAAAATSLPGSCGQAARTLARVALPATLYRVAAGAAGLGVLLAPVAAGAVGASTSVAAAPRSAAPIPTPTWPSDPPTLPAPGWPTTTSPTAPSGPPESVPRPDAHPPNTTAGAQQGHSVVVRTGDSLWGIAATQLGRDGTPARTAVAWPRWYAANRAVIGADPDVIHPGQRLAPPASTGSPR